MLETRVDFVPNGDGWELALKRSLDREHLRAERRPVAIIPGYGMNAFIFGYHPRDLSMEAYLAREGYEVWSLNLRNQGESRCLGGSRLYNLRDLALTDLRCALDHIVEQTETTQERVDVIGASLGGSMLYIHAVLVPHHRLGSLIAMGAPLRWVEINPILRAVFSCPPLIGLIPIGYTRTIAKWIYPYLLRVPAIMNVYLHRELVDVEHIDDMIPTVEDPNRRLNREIAEWIVRRELMIDGVNIAEGMRQVENPLLCLLANGDGIVLPGTALSAIEASGAEIKDVYTVGTEALRFAHADLFISNYSQKMVFRPLADWLAARYHNSSESQPATTLDPSNSETL